MSKPIAIILLNWNTPVHTANCILSIQQYCNAGLFDIVVVDNGSSDGSLTLLQAQFPTLIFIDNQENLGFAEGNNRGLLYSIEKSYTYSLVMNTDTLVDEDIITALSTHLNNYAVAAAVQPSIYWMHDKANLWNGTGYFNEVMGLVYTDTNHPLPGDTFKVAEWVTGCCMLLRNSVLAKSGLFNQHFFLYYEDVELSFRLRTMGHQVHYLSTTKMYHEAGVSAKVEVKKKEGALSPIIHYYISRNRLWFLRKYGTPVYFPIYIIGSLFYYPALYVYFKLRGRNEKASYVIKGLKDGFFTPKNLIWPKNTQ